MSNLKISTGFNLRSGKHAGQSIQTNRSGTAVKRKNQPRKTRSVSQNYFRNFLMQCVRQWRDLSPEIQNTWKSWASTFPQPTKLDVTKFLTGYQLFLKRNYYLFISDPSSFEFMTSPVFQVYEADTLSVKCYFDAGRLYLSCTFLSNSLKWLYSLFLSTSQSSGKKFFTSQTRAFLTVPNSTNEYDITSLFIFNFGRLPKLYDCLFFSAMPAGLANGQFIPRIKMNLVVEPRSISRLSFYYNVREISRIAPPGWHVPNYFDVFDHFASLPNLEEICLSDPSYWNLNPWGFDPDHLQCIGNGFKNPEDSNFYGIKDSDTFLLKLYSFYVAVFIVAGPFEASYLFNDNAGFPLRFVKDDYIPVDFMIGTNGLKYPTTEYLGLIWTTIDSQETLFNDGSPIPEVTDLNLWPSTSVQSFCRRHS